MKTTAFQVAAWAALAALQFGTPAQGRSSSSSIPRVSQYEFLADPVIHRFALNAHSKRDSIWPNKRSFHQKLELHEMIQDDTFHIELRTHNTTYALVVEPNADLLHPEARMTRTLPDGTAVQEPLTTDDIGVYRGYVLRIGAITPQDRSQSLKKWEMFKRGQYTFDEHHSWVRLAVYQDPSSGDRAVLDGMFGVNGETFYIKPASSYMRIKRHSDPMLSNPYSRAPGTRYATSIIYRQSDLINDGGEHSTHRFHRRSAESSVDSRTTCGAHRLANNAPEKLLALGPGDAFYPHRTPADSFRSLRDRGFGLLTKRTNATTNFDQSQAAIKAGCIQARKIVYMGAAADCSYVTQYQSQDKARQQILSDWNQASAVYERQLNVALGLIELQVEDMSCPANVDSSKAWNRGCSESYNIQNRLSDFSTWRGKKGDDGCGLWHLMTNCPTGTEVGLAWLKTLCMTTSSPNTYQGGISSGTGVSAVSRDEWKVVAHEIGHNFGASHDCTSQDCPACANGCDQCCPCTDNCDCKGKYIMNPTSPVSSDDFSPCSIKNMCATISGAVSKCLQDPGKRNTLSTAMCGNGIKETGEECDCGTSEQCKNDPCCDSSTCKLKPGAQCADVNDLCCSQCKLKSNGSVCRPKYSECDIEETCDGQSSDCPSDKHVSDGTSCGNSTAGLKCASGQCTSRDAQCVARGGPDGLTQHCPISMGGDLCDLQCSKPGNPTMCTFMSGSFIDGTDCGFHARCRGGTCKGDNWFYQFLLIFQRNLAISIPIAVAVGLIILAIIIGIFCRCLSCCGLRRAKPKPFLAPQPYTAGPAPAMYAGDYASQPGHPQGYAPPPPPPPPPQQQLYHPQTPNPVMGSSYGNAGSGPHAPSGWVDPSPYNGPAGAFANVGAGGAMGISRTNGSRSSDRAYLDRHIGGASEDPLGDGHTESYQMTDFSSHTPRTDSRPATRASRGTRLNRGPSAASTTMGSNPPHRTRTSALGLLSDDDNNPPPPAYRVGGIY